MDSPRDLHNRNQTFKYPHAASKDTKVGTTSREHIVHIHPVAEKTLPNSGNPHHNTTCVHPLQEEKPLLVADSLHPEHDGNPVYSSLALLSAQSPDTKNTLPLKVSEPSSPIAFLARQIICQLCMTRRSHHRTLACSHTLCLKCMEFRKDKGYFICTSCARLTRMDRDWMRVFRENLQIKSIANYIDIFEDRNSVDSSDGTEKPLCDKSRKSEKAKALLTSKEEESPQATNRAFLADEASSAGLETKLSPLSSKNQKTDIYVTLNMNLMALKGAEKIFDTVLRKLDLDIQTFEYYRDNVEKIIDSRFFQLQSFLTQRRQQLKEEAISKRDSEISTIHKIADDCKQLKVDTIDFFKRVETNLKDKTEENPEDYVSQSTHLLCSLKTVNAFLTSIPHKPLYHEEAAKRKRLNVAVRGFGSIAVDSEEPSEYLTRTCDQKTSIYSDFTEQKDGKEMPDIQKIWQDSSDNNWTFGLPCEAISLPKIQGVTKW